MNKLILPILTTTCAMSQAAIITIAGAAASSTFNGGVAAGNTSNQSLLSGAVNTEADLLTVTHAEQSNANGMWHTAVNEVGGETITFNFTQAEDLGSIWIWQFNQTPNSDRGVNQFDIEVSNDGTNFTLASSLNQTLTISPGGNINAQGFDIAAIGATHVRLTVDSNFGGNVVGLSEVRFSDQTVAQIVPEPSSTALLGLGGLALILRRRK